MTTGGIPVLMDFSTLGNLGNTYFQAQDAARKRAQEDEAARLYEQLAAAQGQAKPAQGDTLATLGVPQQQAPAAGKLPTFAAIEGGNPSGGVRQFAAKAAQQYGIDPNYLTRLAQVESGGNPSAANPNSSARGLYQFMPGTARQYGLADPMDPVASTDAAARLTLDNKAALAKALGREPTQGELYLAHQQGAGGAIKLLTNPNTRAADLVGAGAVVNNGGDANMTAGQFASKWTGKFGGAADRPAPGAATAGFAVPGAAPTQGQQINPALMAGLLRNPQTRQVGLLLMQQAGRPEYGFQVVGDQLVRTNPRTGAAEPVMGANKPAQWQHFQAQNGTTYAFNPQTAEAVAIVQGGGGYRPMTPEERKQFGVPDATGAAMGPDGKPMTLPGTNQTNVNMGAEKAYDQTAGKAAAEQFAEYQKQGRDAGAQLSTIRTMKKLIDTPGFYSGTAGPQVAALKKFAASIGIDAKDAATPMEVFNKLANQLVLDKSGGSLGGGFSNGDRDFIVSTTANLGNTPEGNRMILALAERIAARQQEVAKMAREYAKTHGGRIDSGFEDELARYAEATPLFGDIQAQLQARQSAQAGQGQPGAIPDAAVAYLKQNPNLRFEFDAKYGAGAADRILGPLR